MRINAPSDPLDRVGANEAARCCAAGAIRFDPDDTTEKVAVDYGRCLAFFWRKSGDPITLCCGGFRGDRGSEMEQKWLKGNNADYLGGPDGNHVPVIHPTLSASKAHPRTGNTRPGG